MEGTRPTAAFRAPSFKTPRRACRARSRGHRVRPARASRSIWRSQRRASRSGCRVLAIRTAGTTTPSAPSSAGPPSPASPRVPRPATAAPTRWPQRSAEPAPITPESLSAVPAFSSPTKRRRRRSAPRLLGRPTRTAGTTIPSRRRSAGAPSRAASRARRRAIRGPTRSARWSEGRAPTTPASRPARPAARSTTRRQIRPSRRQLRDPRIRAPGTTTRSARPSAAVHSPAAFRVLRRHTPARTR